MSEDEKLRAMGRLVTDYLDAKRTVATIEAELASIAVRLHSAAKELAENATAPSAPNAFIGIPNYGKVCELLMAYREQKARLEALTVRVRQLGIVE